MKYYSAVKRSDSVYFDGSECHPVGECGHRHRTILAASKCVCLRHQDVALLDTDNYDVDIVDRFDVEKERHMAES